MGSSVGLSFYNKKGLSFYNRKHILENVANKTQPDMFPGGFSKREVVN